LTPTVHYPNEIPSEHICLSYSQYRRAKLDEQGTFMPVGNIVLPLPEVRRGDQCERLDTSSDDPVPLETIQLSWKLPQDDEEALRREDEFFASDDLTLERPPVTVRTLIRMLQRHSAPGRSANGLLWKFPDVCKIKGVDDRVGVVTMVIVDQHHAEDVKLTVEWLPLEPHYPSE